MDKTSLQVDDILIHHGHKWVHEKADLEQGAWYLADPSGQKFAAILPHDRSLPMDKGANAALYVRDYGSDQWHHRDSLPFDEALTSGCAHADRYRERYEAAEIINDVAKLARDDSFPSFSDEDGESYVPDWAEDADDDSDEDALRLKRDRGYSYKREVGF